MANGQNKTGIVVLIAACAVLGTISIMWGTNLGGDWNYRYTIGVILLAIGIGGWAYGWFGGGRNKV